MKHTPGPWKWWTSNSWKRLKREVAGVTTTVLEPYTCSDGQPDVTVTEEDMALIAVAPDLLAALEDVLNDSDVTKGLADWWVIKARSTIAKAKGEK